MTRQTKTPAQRAQEAYDTAARVAERLTKKLRKARADLEAIEREQREAIQRRDFLAGHPDLKKPTTTLKENPS